MHRVNRVCCHCTQQKPSRELGTREWLYGSVFSGSTDYVLVSTPYRNDWFTWQAVYSEHVSPRCQIYDGANMRRGQKKKKIKKIKEWRYWDADSCSCINISTNIKPLERNVFFSTCYPCCCSLCWDILPVGCSGAKHILHLFAFVFQASGSLLQKYRLIKQVGVGVPPKRKCGWWRILEIWASIVK